MTPRQRCRAVEALESLASACENAIVRQAGDENVLAALREAAVALTEALPDPDRPDEW